MGVYIEVDSAAEEVIQTTADLISRNLQAARHCSTDLNGLRDRRVSLATHYARETCGLYIILLCIVSGLYSTVQEIAPPWVLLSIIPEASLLPSSASV